MSEAACQFIKSALTPEKEGEHAGQPPLEAEIAGADTGRDSSLLSSLCHVKVMASTGTRVGNGLEMDAVMDCGHACSAGARLTDE